MSLETTHPSYDAYSEDWTLMRDAMKGESAVKAKRTIYLPATESMLLDGMLNSNQLGFQNYMAYLKRAVFPEYVREAVEALLGRMHRKEATFELPERMKALEKKCTLGGDSLQDLLRRINAEQLLNGRLGLLADLPAEPSSTPDGSQAKETIPYISLYPAESIRNWDEADGTQGFSALNLVVLDECGYRRGPDFTWIPLKQYRVLVLGATDTNEVQGEYRYAVFSDDPGNPNGLTFVDTSLKSPTLRGVAVKEIPFVIINTKDTIGTPDDPPLISLGRLCMSIYRGEADYRQNLFMMGQDTLVVIGGVRNPTGQPGQPGEQDAIRVGAGSRIDVDQNCDAKYIGVNGEGLSEQRECLTNDRKDAQSMAGRLVPVGKADAESGEALKTRISAQTASLTQIAKTGAKGLENELKIIAKWMGLDEGEVEKIKVNPNLDFGDYDFGAEDIVQLMTARGMGAPLSRRSIHGILVDRGMTQMSYEEELELIEEENAQMPPAPGTVGGPNPKMDPHLTDENGNPLNKDELGKESERRAEARENRAARRDATLARRTGTK